MLDLTELFGEGWCVTLVRMEPGRALALMGVREAASVDDGIALATRRLEERCEGPEVMLIGRELRDGWSLVFELEGRSGWVGMDPGVLEAFSVPDQVAVSAFGDPNQIMVQVMRGGVAVGELDVFAGYFIAETVAEDPAVVALLAVGFGLDDEPSGRAAATGLTELAVLALQAVSGVELVEADFDGPWLTGLSVPSRLPMQYPPGAAR